jgi:hypothetical protein
MLFDVIFNQVVWKSNGMEEQIVFCIYHVNSWVRASDRGRIGVFYAFKTPKTHWR